jgi:hypothetical protein
MSLLITRAGKGSPLTNDEMDANLLYLQESLGNSVSFRSDTLLVIDGKIRPVAKPLAGITWNWLLVDTITPLVPSAYVNKLLEVGSVYNGRQVFITYSYQFTSKKISDKTSFVDKMSKKVRKGFSDTNYASDYSKLRLNKRLTSTATATDALVKDINKALLDKPLLISKPILDFTYTLIDAATADDRVYKGVDSLYTSAGNISDSLRYAEKSLSKEVAYLSDTVTIVLDIGGFGIITDAGFVYLSAVATRDYELITLTPVKTFDYGTLT